MSSRSVTEPDRPLQAAAGRRCWRSTHRPTLRQSRVQRAFGDRPVLALWSPWLPDDHSAVPTPVAPTANGSHRAGYPDLSHQVSGELGQMAARHPVPALHPRQDRSPPPFSRHKTDRRLTLLEPTNSGSVPAVPRVEDRATRRLVATARAVRAVLPFQTRSDDRLEASRR